MDRPGPRPIFCRPAREGIHALPVAVLACLPARLHPVSRMILEAFLDGRLTLGDFLWGFHLPNSDYLPVAECIVQALG